MVAAPDHGRPSWTGWQSLGGNITSKPAVVINGSIQFGALNVVAAGTTGRIWYRVYSSGWHAWTALGGPQVRPGTGPGGGFAITGTNDNIYLFGRTGTENGYANFGGLSTNSPGTAPIPAGLVVFARGTDNALWFRPSMLPIGPTGPWHSLGQPDHGRHRDDRQRREDVRVRARHRQQHLDEERRLAVPQRLAAAVTATAPDGPGTLHPGPSASSSPAASAAFRDDRSALDQALSIGLVGYLLREGGG